MKTHKRRGSYKSGGDYNALTKYKYNISKAQITQGNALSNQNPELAKKLINTGKLNFNDANNTLKTSNIFTPNEEKRLTTALETVTPREYSNSTNMIKRAMGIMYREAAKAVAMAEYNLIQNGDTNENIKIAGAEARVKYWEEKTKNLPKGTGKWKIRELKISNQELESLKEPKRTSWWPFSGGRTNKRNKTKRNRN